jgi:hypothetical protein
MNIYLNDVIPEEPIERCVYFLEHMSLYLKYNNSYNREKEYQQTQFIYENMYKLYNTSNYRDILNIFNNTLKIVDNVYARNSKYWFEFTKFLHWKLTN